MTNTTLRAPATGGASVEIVAAVFTAVVIALAGFLSIAQFVTL